MKEINKLAFDLEKLTKLLVINPKLFPVVNSKSKLRKAVVLKINSLYYTFDGDFVNIASFYSNRQKGFSK